MALKIRIVTTRSIIFFRFGHYAGNKINYRSGNADNDNNNTDTDINNSNDNADNADNTYNNNNNDIKLWISIPAKGVIRYIYIYKSK